VKKGRRPLQGPKARTTPLEALAGTASPDHPTKLHTLSPLNAKNRSNLNNRAVPILTHKVVKTYTDLMN
jgi:hypothetical protein